MRRPYLKAQEPSAVGRESLAQRFSPGRASFISVSAVGTTESLPSLRGSDSLLFIPLKRWAMLSRPTGLTGFHSGQNCLQLIRHFLPQRFSSEVNQPGELCLAIEKLTTGSANCYLMIPRCDDSINFTSNSTSSPCAPSARSFSTACEVLSFDASNTLNA
jgi:hypothetical protein